MSLPLVSGSALRSLFGGPPPKPPASADPAASAVFDLPAAQRADPAASVKVRWHWSIADIPPTAPCIMISNEFLDALPIHQFQFTDRGWREILVDVDVGPGPHHFRYVLAPEPTPASRAFVRPLKEGESADAPATPPPSTSPLPQPGKHQRLVGTIEEIQAALPKRVRIGDTYELSPAAFVSMEQTTLRLMRTGGAALYIDYGDSDTGFQFVDNPAGGSGAGSVLPTISDNVSRELSLMGIKQHAHADALSEPGLVDLSSHVNFGALAAVARRTVNQVTAMLRKPAGSLEHSRALEALGLVSRRTARAAAAAAAPHVGPRAAMGMPTAAAGGAAADTPVVPATAEDIVAVKSAAAGPTGAEADGAAPASAAGAAAVSSSS